MRTALRMLRERRSAGLTARRLGSALVAGDALYRYFAGLDDLTRAIGEEADGAGLGQLEGQRSGGPICTPSVWRSTPPISRIPRPRC